MASANIRSIADQLEGALLPAAMPMRSLSAMPPQSLIAWTPALMLRTAIDWLMEEQRLEYRR